MTKLKFWVIAAIFLSLGGCATIHLGPSFQKPIQEHIIEAGHSDNKVLIVQINGIIDDQPKEGVFSQAPSLLDALMMQLNKAEKDDKIVALLLKVNSPGGGVTVSDTIFHELQQFKQRTGKKIFVQMMSLAASGGVYISMAADHIQAHPSTITGSVGVISITADLSDTLAKIGAKVNVYKTGVNKDMGSPFKATTETDQQAFQSIVDGMAETFYRLIDEHRSITDEDMAQLKTAKVMRGTEALKIGLVDSLGYLSDATSKACHLGGAKQCRVVSYRFHENKNANTYSPTMTNTTVKPVALVNVPIMKSLQIPSGAYYLYLH